MTGDLTMVSTDARQLRRGAAQPSDESGTPDGFDGRDARSSRSELRSGLAVLVLHLDERRAAVAQGAEVASVEGVGEQGGVDAGGRRSRLHPLPRREGSEAAGRDD